MAISTPMNCGSKGEYYTVHVGGTSLFLINLYVNMVHVLCEISLLNAKRSNSLNYFTTSSFFFEHTLNCFLIQKSRIFYFVSHSV